jgi:pilus assembly protein Flp/PilA
MKNSKLLLHSFLQDESGQDLIEYALVAAVIGLGSVAAMSTLAGNITALFGTIGTALTSNA